MFGLGIWRYRRAGSLWSDQGWTALAMDRRASRRHFSDTALFSAPRAADPCAGTWDLDIAGSGRQLTGAGIAGEICARPAHIGDRLVLLPDDHVALR